MQILYILQASSHARYWRRINNMEDLGAHSYVYAFEREKFYKGKKDTKHYISLGSIKQEKYIKRLLPLIKSIKLIRKEIKNVDVIYAFGLDTFLIGWVASLLKRNKPKFVYEVGDIRSVFTNEGLKARLFRFVERFVLKKMDLLVVTSEAYVHGYFINIQKYHKMNYHVIENKPELQIQFTQDSVTSDNKKIRIGYFGVIRCERSLEILNRLVTQHNDKFELYIRGIISQGENIINEMSSMENVVVEGEYKVPDDLPSMYNQIDMIWACYPYMGEKVGNWMWARTTRFYEACYFKKPMVTLKGTQDAKYVNEKGIGIVADLSNVELVVKLLSELNRKQIEAMNDNFIDVSADVYTYSNEHDILISKLKQ